MITNFRTACRASFLALALTVPGNSFAAEPEAKTLAAKYFEALFVGDAQTAMSMAQVPFFFDKKKVLTTPEQLETIHRKMTRNSGNRQLKAYTVEKSLEAAPLDPQIFPKYLVFHLVHEGQGGDIYVTDGSNPKVIGYSD